VPCGDIRQSNCYYSSSDVAFKSRYEADERYDEIKSGNITLKGGWRVYSSGPGIYIGIIVSRLLGLRVEYGNIIIDPIIPHSLSDLTATIDYFGYPLTFKFIVKENNYGPQAIYVNGKSIELILEDNKYRRGGAVIQKDQLLSMFNISENIIRVVL
jgi:cellobiose phosphorylase